VLISEGMPLDAKAARPKKRAAGGSLAEAEAAEDDDMVRAGPILIHLYQHTLPPHKVSRWCELDQH
jgi:hypothetical protein